jgi:hypothetical protein
MRLLATFIVLASLPLAAQDPDWTRFQFLLGKWTGVPDEKGSQLGPGRGECSFDFDLGGKIIIRRNSASYDSGIKHDDLLVIYADGAPRAIYFDNEGHVIHYNIRLTPEGRIVFESDQPGPRYRLSYWSEGRDLITTFEIALPGAAYKNYAGGRLRRAGAR